MNKTCDIAILLSTFNGAQFLRELLDSIIQQTYTEWQLFVHDDGSNDNTLDILQEYQQRDARIHVLTYPSTGSACANFMSLLHAVEAPYYMFCDQDDVWLANKIEIEFNRMQTLEQKHSNSPIIVHTDLCVVDRNLNTINPSFWDMEHIHPQSFLTWLDYANGNLTTGCTMLLNEHAKQVTLPLSSYTLMHDAWITLCVAAQSGIIESMHIAPILYRQHDANTLGAHDASVYTLRYRIHNFKQMLTANVAHFNQMNAIRPISVWQYIKHKIIA